MSEKLKQLGNKQNVSKQNNNVTRYIQEFLRTMTVNSNMSPQQPRRPMGTHNSPHVKSSKRKSLTLMTGLTNRFDLEQTLEPKQRDRQASLKKQNRLEQDLKVQNKIMRLIIQKMKAKKSTKDYSNQLRNISAIPEPNIAEKFSYFYGGYNQVANTAKYLTFGDIEIPNRPENLIREYYMIKQKLENSRGGIDEHRNEQIIEIIDEAIQERISMSSKGWEKVFNFLSQSDQRPVIFVINQLRKILGNRKPIKKKQKTAEEKLVLREKKSKFFDRLLDAKIVIHLPTSQNEKPQILNSLSPQKQQSNKDVIGEYHLQLNQLDDFYLGSDSLCSSDFNSYDDPNEQKNKEKAIVLDAIDDLDDVPLRINSSLRSSSVHSSLMADTMKMVKNFTMNLEKKVEINENLSRLKTSLHKRENESPPNPSLFVRLSQPIQRLHTTSYELKKNLSQPLTSLKHQFMRSSNLNHNSSQCTTEAKMTLKPQQIQETISSIVSETSSNTSNEKFNKLKLSLKAVEEEKKQQTNLVSKRRLNSFRITQLRKSHVNQPNIKNFIKTFQDNLDQQTLVAQNKDVLTEVDVRSQTLNSTTHISCNSPYRTQNTFTIFNGEQDFSNKRYSQVEGYLKIPILKFDHRLITERVKSGRQLRQQSPIKLVQQGSYNVSLKKELKTTQEHSRRLVARYRN